MFSSFLDNKIIFVLKINDGIKHLRCWGFNRKKKPKNY